MTMEHDDEASRNREIHESHDPEPDGVRVYRGGHTCRRCCRFVAHENGRYRVTDAGAAPCRPGELELREVEPERSAGATRERIEAALVGLELPAQPVDGDCLVFEPLVRELLARAGLGPKAATVYGWCDPGQQILAWAHQATACAGYIVDVTARMYGPSLPARFVEPVGRYGFLLARAAALPSITVRIR
jgi:hypothetical protein